MAAVASGAYRLRLRRLRLELCLGVEAGERMRTREVFVDVALDVVKGWGETPPEEMREVVCYATLAGKIVEAFQGRRVALVENMAERIASMCLAEDGRVEAAWVRVSKPNAVPGCAAAEVEICRRRGDLRT